MSGVAAGVLVAVGLPALPAAAIPPEDAITYVYDDLGRLEAVINPAVSNGVARYTYHGAGNLISITRQSTTSTRIVDFQPKTAIRGAEVIVYGAGYSATPSQNTVRFGGRRARSPR